MKFEGCQTRVLRVILYNKMSREMKKGLVDLIVLSVISRGSVSGVDLVFALEGVFTAGTIYPALARMEKAGLLEATKRTADTGRTRKEYDLSPSGQRELGLLFEVWDSLSRAVRKFRTEAHHGT